MDVPVTPPPVVELLRAVAEQVNDPRKGRVFAETAAALEALADSLSEITPERVEALSAILDRTDHGAGYSGYCDHCKAKPLLAALSRISSGEAK